MSNQNKSIMTFNFLLRKDKVRKDGQAPIYIVLKSGEKISTGLSTYYKSDSDTYWDQAKQRIKKSSDAKIINDQLTRLELAMSSILEAETDVTQIRTLADAYLANPNGFTIDEVRKAKADQAYEQQRREEMIIVERGITHEKTRKFYNNLTEKGKKFFLFMELFIKENSINWSDGYCKKFRNLRTKILWFDPEFDTSKISLAWMQTFIDYCFDELENEHNTVQGNWDTLKEVCKYLDEKGMPYNKDIKKLKMSYIEPKIQPLTFAQVKAIADLDLSLSMDESMKASRFVWVMAAYLGQRWSDILRTTKHNFTWEQDGKGIHRWFYTIRQQKTKAALKVGLCPEAVEWIKPATFAGVPDVNHQTVNLHIKILAERAEINDTVQLNKVDKNGNVYEEYVPRHETVHIHTARHTFAVEMCKRYAGKPGAEKLISDLLGHASPATTWRYLNFTTSEKESLFFEVIDQRAAIMKVA